MQYALTGLIVHNTFFHTEKADCKPHCHSFIQVDTAIMEFIQLYQNECDIRLSDSGPLQNTLGKVKNENIDIGFKVKVEDKSIADVKG